MTKRKRRRRLPKTQVGPVHLRAIRGPKEDRWYWRAEVYEGRKSRTIWSGWMNQKAASAHLANLVARDELDPQPVPQVELHTVRDLMEVWIAAIDDQANLARLTKRNYRNSARHLATRLGMVPLTSFNFLVLEDYRNARLKSGRETGPVFASLFIGPPGCPQPHHRSPLTPPVSTTPIPPSINGSDGDGCGG